MGIKIAFVTATASGAAFPGARTARTSFDGMPVESAGVHAAALVAGPQPALSAACWPVPAPLALVANPAAAPLTVMHTRKQTTNVHKTRINAGGYGAMGPHPEREPA